MEESQGWDAFLKASKLTSRQTNSITRDMEKPCLGRIPGANRQTDGKKASEESAVPPAFGEEQTK